MNFQAMKVDGRMFADDMANKVGREETGYIGRMIMYCCKQDRMFLENCHQESNQVQPTEFFEELHAVIDRPQQSASYHILWEPGEPAWVHGDYRRRAKASSRLDFGVRVDTVQHTYLFRCDGGSCSRNVRIFCYDKETLRVFSGLLPPPLVKNHPPDNFLLEVAASC